MRHFAGSLDFNKMIIIVVWVFCGLWLHTQSCGCKKMSSHEGCLCLSAHKDSTWIHVGRSFKFSQHSCFHLKYGILTLKKNLILNLGWQHWLQFIIKRPITVTALPQNPSRRIELFQIWTVQDRVVPIRIFDTDFKNIFTVLSCVFPLITADQSRK